MLSIVVNAIVLTVSVLFAVSSSQFCGITPPVWRNDNMTCPSRAVCADVFEQTRDWYNGTTCWERRTQHNCMCPDNKVCPFHNDDHMLYASNSHKRYTCEPKCTLPWCNGVEPRLDRFGIPRPTNAIVNEVESMEFGQRSFYRMLCRCSRHHVPRPRVGNSLFRATRTSSWGRHYQWHTRRVYYACRGSRQEQNIPDPCQ